MNLKVGAFFHLHFCYNS